MNRFKVLILAFSLTCNIAFCDIRYELNREINNYTSNKLPPSTALEVEVALPVPNSIDGPKETYSKPTDGSYNQFQSTFLEGIKTSDFYDEAPSEESVLPVAVGPNYDLVNQTQLEKIRFNRGDIIVKSFPIEVLYGRVTIISPEKHLSISPIAMGPDKCTIKVLNDGALLPRAGQLHPSEFDCQFGRNEVWYSHLGGRNPQLDLIKIMIKYQTEYDTFVVPAMLQFRVVYDKQLEVVIKNIPLKVENNLGISNKVDLSNTVFLYDDELFDCFVTIFSEAVQLPRYGRFFSQEPHLGNKSFVSCDEFLGSNFYYQHDVSTSLRTDFVPVKVELWNKTSRYLIKEEFFYKTVLIPSGKINQPPVLSRSSSLQLEVYHPYLTPVTPKTILVTDKETPGKNILFVVKNNLESEYGRLVITDSPLMPISSFYQKDVFDNKIAFSLSDNMESNPSLKQVKFSLAALDEEGASSETFELTASLHPWTNTMPYSMKIEGLGLLKGQTQVMNFIDVNETFSYGEDTNDVINFHIIKGPKHGTIMLNGSDTQSFTSSDLFSSLVTYKHDGNETFSDNLVLELFANNKIFEFLLPISIFPVDNSPPHLISKERVFNVTAGEWFLITESYLNARNDGQDDSIVVYQLTQPLSKYGHFVLSPAAVPSSPSNNILTNSASDQGATNWTQLDISEGRLFFVVKDSNERINASETIGFILRDTGDPPNYSEQQNLSIRIISEPEIHKINNKPVSTFEYQTISITREFLLYGIRNDSNDPNYDMDLSYIFEFNEHKGSFYASDRQNIPINKFTQRQINENNIIYRPPNIEVGIHSMTINFPFNITYKTLASFNRNSLIVFIKPVNNMAPVVQIERAEIPEGSHSIVLTRNIIKLHDEDTDEAELLFRLISAPTEGYVFYKSQKLIPGSEFTIKDIENENIRYVVATQESPKNDYFDMEIDDRIHRVLFTIDIISGKDIETPLAVLNTISPIITVDESSKVQLTGDILLPDSASKSNDNFTFIIQRAPLHGMILRDGKSILKFSLDDLQRASVAYSHDREEIGMDPINDQFHLMVVNGSPESASGMESHSIKVDVNINPIDNSPPDVTEQLPISVKEGFQTVIGLKNINISDPDSNIHRIACDITSPPTYGSLIWNESHVIIQSFTYDDLVSMKLIYLQNVSNQIEPRSDSFAMRCNDGVTTTPDVFLTIEIFPFNDEIPVTEVRSVLVKEGESIVLQTAHLKTEDWDEPKDTITYSVSVPPKHGTLYREAKDESLFTFSQDELVEGKIRYRHDGSESTGDDFEIVVGDGDPDHDRSYIVQIKVTQIDDQPPEVNINNGISLNMNESRVITSRALSSVDLDSSAGDIIYILKSLPRFGLLEFLSPTTRQPIEKFSYDSSFSQKDIDNSYIRYRNTVYSTTNDSFSFELADRINTTRSGKRNSFSIDLKDPVPPTIVNEGVQLNRGGWVYLTTSVLRVIDQNTPDKYLRFTIIEKPRKGELKHIDLPSEEVKTFSQLDLQTTKILYIHNSKYNDSSDSFGFSVSDGFNVVNRIFKISIIDVNSEKPILYLSPLEVEKGLSTIITHSNLKIEDSQESPSDLTFIISSFPKFGSVLLDSKIKVEKFSQAQVNAKKISYHHDGSKSDMDEFHIVVTDGFHDDFFLYPNVDVPTNKPQTVHIKIRAMEQLTLKDGLRQGLQPQYIPRNKFKGFKAKLIFKITASNLNTAGVESHPGSIIYIIEEPPKSGYICNVKDVMKPLSSFTQDDVNNGVIRFVSNEDTKATYDVVKFRLMDEAKGLTTSGKVQFEWSFIKLEKDFYAVNQSEQVDIFLLRRGSLEPAASVNLTVYNSKDQPMFTNQVKFSPGQTKVKWTFTAAKNNHITEVETVRVKISDGVMAAIEEPDEATIFIRDNAEESIVEFTQEIQRVTEQSKKIKLKLKRTGDSNKGQEVLCYTQEGKANGTKRGKLDTFSDFVSRLKDKSSLVRFKDRQKEAYCEVQIIDDSLLEGEEYFSVHLASINGGRIGKKNNVTVLIEEDVSDYPRIFFAKSEHYVTEGSGHFDVWIFRSGSDLRATSSVEVVARSPQTKWRKNSNNLPVIPPVEFPPESKSQPVTISIFDDSGRSLIGGLETFSLSLRSPKNAKVDGRSETSVVIKDRTVDVPVFEFTTDEYKVHEGGGIVKILIQRKGDTSSSVSVRCYTRSGSATDEQDFIGRPDSEYSKITFKKGDTKQFCEVQIVDDQIFEKDEYFGVFLSSPEVESGKAIVGPKNFARVIIDDAGDEPTIFFEKSQITAVEPAVGGDIYELKVKVLRKGYLSSWVLFRVYSNNGTATSRNDYNSFNKELYFYPDSTEVELNIEILGDSKVETKEMFSLNLEYLKSSTDQEVKVTTPQAVVFIEDPKISHDKGFPAPPIIMSANGASFSNQSIMAPGFPVICVTVCDELHPHFTNTRHSCQERNIDNSRTKFRWQVAGGVGSGSWRDVPRLSFLNSNRVLDKLFVIPKSSVQCYATAVSHGGDVSYEVKSKPAAVGASGGPCPQINGTHLAVEPYTSKIKYKDHNDFENPNTVSIEVLVPYQDGMIPIISTRRISNFGQTPQEDFYRSGTHKCSNMADLEKQMTPELNPPDKKNDIPYSQIKRLYEAGFEKKSQSFSRFPNEESCMWKWRGFYTISELSTKCGAEIGVDKQNLNSVQNQLHLLIPLFVTYAFYAPDVASNWKHVHQSSELRLNLVYDTSLLLSGGLQSTGPASADDPEPMVGVLRFNMLQTDSTGRITVEFTTEAQFHGKFVLKHSNMAFESDVKLLGHPELTFSLTEIHSEQEKKLEIQKWKFFSDYAIKDYSGTYVIRLIPCFINEDNYAAREIDTCRPREAVNFEMEIKLQQVKQLVAEQFSLNSIVKMTSDKDKWFDIPVGENQNDSEVIFYPGDRIYGSVSLNPVDILADGFHISIEKCYVCTGYHGYVPKFDPKGGEFGCIKNTEEIRTYKIIDKYDSTDQDRHLRNIPFNAQLIGEEKMTNYSRFPLVEKMDGFSFDVHPLFQISEGGRWFIHVIFVIEKNEPGTSGKGIIKRQTLFQMASSSGKSQKLSTHSEVISTDGRTPTYEGETRRIDKSTIRSNSFNEIGTNGLGTNMRTFYVRYRPPGSATYTVIDWDFLPQYLIAFLGVIVFVTCLAIASIVLYNRKKRKESRNHGFYSTVATTDRTLSIDKQLDGDERKLPKVLSFYSSYDEVTEV